MKFVIILILLGNFCVAQEKNFIDKPYIEIVHEEDTMVTPNEIYLSYTLFENNLKKYNSIEEVEDIIYKTFEKEDLNPLENLKLVNADNVIKREFLKTNSSVTSKEFEIKVGDYKEVNKVFRILDSIGLITVKIEKTSYNKSKDIIDLMYIKASRNCKEKAYKMAKAVNRQIGEVLFIQTGVIENEIDIRQNRVRNYYRKESGQALWWMNPTSYYIDLDMQKIKIKVKILERIELK